MLVFEQSAIDGVCGMGPGDHKMESEGVGMSGQEQLFLRRVLTTVNEDDKELESVLIWRGEDGSCGICC